MSYMYIHIHISLNTILSPLNSAMPVSCFFLRLLASQDGCKFDVFEVSLFALFVAVDPKETKNRIIPNNDHTPKQIWTNSSVQNKQGQIRLNNELTRSTAKLVNSVI